MTAKKPPGVFCLEGEWDDTIESTLSIEPALRLLEARDDIRLVHRDVATKAELRYYLNRWLGTRLRGYDFGYLGFHGSAEYLYIGDETLSLDELADMFDGRCGGKVLYFGSCSVLAAPDSVLTKFCRDTGARAVAGYTKDVDWIETAAFELLLVSKLVYSTNMKPAYTSLCKTYPDLTRRLGFRMAHSTWASDRTIAVLASDSS
ncbi:hypothetical protein B2J88_15970 [Rhodococcus sp. SRB_17]|nr:hypothetical protein [Rhodococcus sp. SRB_17]